ncbi:MAG: hypothetical protein ACI8RD_013944, partial [Bacillariaceae sp.]
VRDGESRRVTHARRQSFSKVVGFLQLKFVNFDNLHS